MSNDNWSDPRLPVAELTQYAAHSSMIADVFRAAVSRINLGACSVDLTSPKESTRGGTLSLQHIRLRHPSGRTLVIGSVDAAKKEAFVRTHAWIASAYLLRLKTPVDFDKLAYDALLRAATDVLSGFGLQLEVRPGDDAGRDEQDLEDSPNRRPSKHALLVGLMVLGAAGAAVAYVMLRRH